MILCCEINKLHNNRETVIIPQTITVPTKSIIVASLLSPLRQMESAYSTTSTTGSFWPSQRRFRHRKRPLLLSHLCCLGLRVILPRAYCHPANKFCSWAQLLTVKSSHLYLYSAFNNTNCVKATAQYQNRNILS